MMKVVYVDESVGYRRGFLGESHFFGEVDPCIVIGASYKGRPYTVHSLPGSGFEEKLDRLLHDLTTDVEQRNKLNIFIILGALEDHQKDERYLLWKKLRERGYWPSVKQIVECHGNTTYSLTINSEGIEIKETELYLD